MSLDINLEYFVDGSMGYNLKSTEEYKKNIDLCSKASENSLMKFLTLLLLATRIQQN
jgi:hypothetical protein